MDRKSNNTAINLLLFTNNAIQKCENGATGPIYIGLADAGTADADLKWLIKKITYDVNGLVTSILYADGKNDAVKSWTLRATYTYS